MTPKEVFDLATRCINEGNRADWMALAAPDLDLEGQRPGTELWGQIFDQLREALPDLHYEVVSYVEHGPDTASELRLTGTHAGVMRLPRTPTAIDESDMVEIPPTGKHVDFVYAEFNRIVNGLFVYSHAYGFTSGMAEQLGVLSVQPAKQPA